MDVKVTYYLNGKETPAKEMAGVSGRIKIRFDYTNRTYRKIRINDEILRTPVPFAAISMVPMPDDVFSGIEISSGRVVNFGGENIAVGYAFAGVNEFIGEDNMDSPGSDYDDYVEITADARDFSLEFTETVLTTGFFEDADTESLDDLLELQDAVKELKDISDEMCDAANDLSDGTGEFADYLEEYVNGVGELVGGAYTLSDGLSQLYSSTDLTSGADTLKEGVASLKTAIRQYQEADQNKENAELYATLLSYVDQLETGASVLASGAYAYREAVGTASSGAAALAGGIDQLSTAGTELNDGFSEVTDGVKKFKDAVDKFKDEGVSKMEEEAGEDPTAYVNKIKALKEADTKYKNFGGVRDGVESEVRFLIETEGIGK